jgi:hypothetical protein
MALSVMINLDDMLFAAYTLGAEISETTPRLSKEELRAKLLADVPLIASTGPTKPAKKTKTAPKTETSDAEEDETATEKPETAATADKPKTEKKKAEKKPKAEPEGDVRCCARSLYEKDHIEAGKPKAMREDETNQFGDRCKFKKVGETNFCKSHAEKQPHGVWGAEYAGKLKTLIEKANAPVEEPKAKAAKEDKPKAAKEDKPKAAKEDKPKAAKEDKPKAAKEDKPKAAKEDKPKAPKKVVKKAVAKPAAEETEEPTTPTKPTKTVKPNAPKRPAKKENEDDVEEDAEDEYMAADALEKANIEYEWITINDQDYMIDANGNVYDPESEEKVGVYDVKAKKWTSGGPASESE